jgi:hypothetical protein
VANVVDTVRVEVPVPPTDRVILVGAKLKVGSDGTILANRVTVPEKPLMLANDIVDEAEEPCTMLRLTGLAEMEKSGILTKTEIDEEWNRDPLAPDTSTE